MPIISISLPEKQIKQLNQLTQKSNRPRSQIMKEALDLYTIETEWQSLRKTGDKIAKQLEIETDDDVERIFG